MAGDLALQRVAVIIISQIFVIAFCFTVPFVITYKPLNVTAAWAKQGLGPLGLAAQSIRPTPSPPPVNDSALPPSPPPPPGSYSIRSLWVTKSSPGATTPVSCIADDSGASRRLFARVDLAPQAVQVPDTGTVLVVYEQARWDASLDASSRLAVLRGNISSGLPFTQCGGGVGSGDRVTEARVAAISSRAVVVVARVLTLSSAFDPGARETDTLAALVSRDDGVTWESLALAATGESVEDLVVLAEEFALVTRDARGYWVRRAMATGSFSAPVSLGGAAPPPLAHRRGGGATLVASTSPVQARHVALFAAPLEDGSGALELVVVGARSANATRRLIGFTPTPFIQVWRAQSVRFPGALACPPHTRGGGGLRT